MSQLVKIFDPDSSSGPMRLACFMSGSGTNVTKIIENHRKKAQEYKVVLIFTDNDDPSTCNAKNIAQSYGIPLKIHDMKKFYFSHGEDSKRDLTLRSRFDQMTAELIEPYNLDLISLGGYMSILTRPILDRFPGKIINVHPSDLSIQAAGKRKFIGLHVVRDAIMSGESHLFSTTHIVREEVDNGEILMRSQPVKIILPEGLTLRDFRKIENRAILDQLVIDHQAKLKEYGDWIILPKTIELISEGHFFLDGKGSVYFDNQMLPNGLRLEVMT